jgi:hypothetical protein
VAHLRGIELFMDEALVELLGVLEQLLAELLHTLPFEHRAVADLGEAIDRVASHAKAGLSPIPLTRGPNRLPDAHACGQQQEHYKQAGHTQGGAVFPGQLSQPVARSRRAGFDRLVVQVALDVPG